MIAPVYCWFCLRSEAELSYRPVAGPNNVRICIECCDLAKAAMTAPDRAEGRDTISYAEFKARNPYRADLTEEEFAERLHKAGWPEVEIKAELKRIHEDDEGGL